MISTQLTPSALQALPRAIWMAGQPPTVYRGTPLQMVEAMRAEMEPSDLPLRVAIEEILSGLLRNKGLFIALPNVSSDETLARLFVYALLNTGVGRRLAEA